VSTHLKMGSPFIKLSLLSADQGQVIVSTSLEDTAFRKAWNQQDALNHIAEQEGKLF